MSTLCNAATKKPAYQISDFVTNGIPYRAALATDGIDISDFMAGSCSVTGYETSPWWVVDLGAAMNVNFVVLTTRKYGRQSHRPIAVVIFKGVGTKSTLRGQSKLDARMAGVLAGEGSK